MIPQTLQGTPPHLLPLDTFKVVTGLKSVWSVFMLQCWGDFHFRNMQLRSKANTTFQRRRTPGWKEILSCIYMKELLYVSPEWSSHCRPNLLHLSVSWFFLTNTHTRRRMIHAVHMQYEKDANSFKPKYRNIMNWHQISGLPARELMKTSRALCVVCFVSKYCNTHIH